MSFLKRLKNNKFFSNILVLATGSVIAQVLAVLASPFLTRLYEPSEIGLYTYIISVVSIFLPILNLRYDMSIVSEKEEKNVWALVKLSFLIGITVSIIATIGFSIYFFVVKKEYSAYKYSLIFFLLILLADVLINILNSYNNRTNEYKIMTSVSVIRSACQNIGSVFLGFCHLGLFGLILPYTLGQFLGLKKQSVTLKRHKDEIKHVSNQDMKHVALKHKNMPLYSTPAMLANSFSYSSITIFIEMIFSMETVGFYSISTRVLGIPLSLISGNVSKVFFQEAAKENEKTGGYKSSFKKTTLFLIALAIPMGIVLYVLSPWACSFFFGEGWGVAGDYIRILLPYYMLRFIGTALSPALIVSNKQNQELLIQILLVITSILALVCTLATQKTVETFLGYISIFKSVVYAILIVLVWHNSKKKGE